MFALLLGCAGSLSNDIFEQDRAFTEVLPTSQGIAPSWAPGDLDSDAVLLALAEDGLRNVAQQLDPALDIGATVTLVSPTERGEHHRVWGPGAFDAFPGSFLRVEMSRTSDLGLYVYSYQAAPTSAGPWDTEFFVGRASVDDPASYWQGELDFDGQALSGVVDEDAGDSFTLRYRVESTDEEEAEDTREALEFEYETWDGAGQMWFREDAERGQLQARGAATLGGSTHPTDLVVRWTREGAGRADARRGDDHAGECWDAQGQVVWAWSSTGDLLDDTGAEADCAFPEAAELDRF